jgi:hypothetical protein
MSITTPSSEQSLDDDVTGNKAGLNAGSQPSQGTPDERDYLAYTKDALKHSDDFLNAFLIKHWERSNDQFRSKHPSGSKYNSDEYKARSKLFRPKTRTTVKRHEAGCAAAFFSTQDVVNIAAVNTQEPRSRASAEMTQSLLQHRLTSSTEVGGIPWFLTLNGAFQVSQIQGICVSKQYWKYEELTTTKYQPLLDEYGDPRTDEAGTPLMQPVEHKEVVEDRPVIDMLPPENVRIHEGADWKDPVNTSPFVIIKYPMFVGDVRDRMKSIDPKTGQPRWTSAEDPTIALARVDQTSNIRQKRSGYDSVNAIGVSDTIRDNELVWCNEVFYRIEGEELVWWTLGDQAMLSEPKPTREVYKHCGRRGRPVVMGYGSLEAFTVFPQSQVAQLHDLQVAANDVQNLRLDGVKLSLHPRTRVKAGTNLDLRTIANGAPGSVTVHADPTNDVVYDRPPDVTSAAYAEQDRVNADFDDLGGSFSQGSVATNRRMNETVGGMSLMSNSANAVSEYDLRVFAETWVEPVLRQLVRLEQAYETDENLLALAGQEAQIFERYGIDPKLDWLLDEDLVVTVSVGLGNTDPSVRVQKFTFALNTLLQLAGGLTQLYGGPQVLETPGFEAITKEIFGSVGYKDGARFLDFKPPQQQGQMDPQMQQAMQMIQQLQQQLAEAQQGGQIQVALKQIDAQSKAQSDQTRAQTEIQREVVRGQFGNQRQQIHGQTALSVADINAQKARTDTLLEQISNHAAGMASSGHFVN